MKYIKNIFVILILIPFLVYINQTKVISQEEQNQAETQVTQEEKTEEVKKKKRGFFFFKHRERKEEVQEETKAEPETIKKTEETVSPRKELREKQREEWKELIEKHRKEKEELKEKLQEERSKERNLREKVQEERTKNRYVTKEQIHNRKKEIWDARWSKRFVDVITNENDPLYILDADVLNTKTKFMKIKNVEFKYRIKLQNQTPKIINSVLLVWERKLPFTETLTIARETKISEPIVPYEKKTIEYNELDSKREGELYRIKVSKIIFEDGTQWINPIKMRNHY